MAGTLAYLDPSALVIVVLEPERSALTRFLGRWQSRVTSRVSAVEVSRAVLRSGVPELVGRANEVLESVALIELDGGIARRAGELEPAALRTLDAIHVASALSLGSDAGPFLAYDVRLRQAAAAAGLEVQAPA